MHAEIVEARIVEVAEHGLLGRVRHGVRVLRAVPELRLAAVAEAQVSLPTKLSACAELAGLAAALAGDP